MTAAPLPYDHPTRLGLRQLVGGDAEAALESARGYQRQHHLDRLPAAAVPGVLAGLKRRVIKVLRGVGLFVALEGGAAFEVRDLDQVDPAALEALLAGKQHPGPGQLSMTPAAIRKRRERKRKAEAEAEAQARGQGRAAAPAPSVPPPAPLAPTAAPVTASVTPSVTGRDRGRDIENCHAVTASGTAASPGPESPENPPKSGPVQGVTSSREPARGENSPSSPSILFSKDREDGEAPLSRAEALDSTVARVEALWSEVTGRPGTDLKGADSNAIRVRVQEGAKLHEFRAAFAHSSLSEWYLADASRQLPRLVCGSRWDECRRKGSVRLSQSAPASAPPPSSRPVPASALRPAPPAPPALESLPAEIRFVDRPGHSPGRKLPHLGHDYVPVRERGVWLRPDLFRAQAPTLPALASAGSAPPPPAVAVQQNTG